MSFLKRNERDLFPGKCATIATRGRKQNLKPDNFRTEFQRDIHRIIYSRSFRRLRHKTQVFYFPQNDHVSTRMDHVLFVSSAARTVARCLGLNEDLAEAIGLAHDIGHPPFGHQGEMFLNSIIKENDVLKKYMPVFNHEVYGLRVVDLLAKRDREVPGLNLTWEVRDGIISHCGEDFTTCKLAPAGKSKVLEEIKSKHQAGNPATMEGCIVRLVDKIVYCGKDIEDAIATKIIEEKDVPPEINKHLGKTNGQIIGTFLEDIIKNSYDKDYIAISKEYGQLLHQMIQFNIINIYHGEKSKGYSAQAGQSIKLLFKALLARLKETGRFKTPETDNCNTTQIYKVFSNFVCGDMNGVYTESDPPELIVLDFIAGMTDSFAVRSFQELFVPQATV